MSATIQMTTEEAAAKEQQAAAAAAGDVMVDSGISSASLRLSLQGSLTSSTRSAEGAGERDEAVPAVKMPTSPTKAAPNALEDSGVGICQDMKQLSLGGGGGGEGEAAAAAGLRDDAWQEYYEQDEDGDVQLHLAIASGFVDVVYALVRMAPHPDYLSIQNNALYSPLHIAVLQNQPSVVRRLVVAGARLDVRDREGNTPLHLAARRGNLECGEALLKPVSVQEMSEQSQSHVLYTQLPVDVIDLCNHAGEACVHLAAMGGHAHFLRFLCWNNADMNAADGRAGRSALHFAIGTGRLEVIECLVEPRPTGCGVDVNRLDWYGRSAYQLALLNGARAIALFLESRVAGLDTTPPSVEGSSGGSEEEDDLLRGAMLLNSSA